MGMITETPLTYSQLKATTQCDAIPRSTLLANSRVPVYENYSGNSDQEREHIRRQNEISLLTKQLTNSGWGRTSQALASTLVTHETFQQFDINATCDKTIYLTKKTSDINIDILDLMTALKQCYDKAASNGLTKLCFKVLKDGTIYVTFNAEKSADVLMTNLMLASCEQKDKIINRICSSSHSNSLLNLHANQETLIQHYFSLPA